jgi:hypothetical protein
MLKNMSWTAQIQSTWIKQPVEANRLRLLISEDGDEELILFVNELSLGFCSFARLLVTEKSVCVQLVPRSSVA